MIDSIDIFCHCLPPEYCRAAIEIAVRPLHMLNRAQTIPVAVDVEARLTLMDRFPGYRQVLSLASPPLEIIAGPDVTPDLARLANDAMARMVSQYPDRFPGFVASVGLNNMDAALVETERAIKTLKACGVQIFTNINGRPLDDLEFLPLFDLMAQFDRPIWLHPARGMNVPDYATENVSKFELWWALGWPYETSVAMARIVFAGVFERWPQLKIITHHMGGMIPMMEGRLSPGLDVLGARTPPEHRDAITSALTERPIDAFHCFYADTASFGSRLAIECGLAFFGIEKMLFASDMPFGPQGGLDHIQQTLRAIHEMDLSDEARGQILSGNACRLFNIKAQ